MRLINMEKFPNYMFTMSGKVYKKDKAMEIYPTFLNKTPYYEIELNASIIEVNGLKLFSEIYFGNILEFSIIFKDGDYTNLDSQNMLYNIPFDKVMEFSNPMIHIVYLEGLIFKRISDNPNYFISNNGMIYSNHKRNFMIFNYDKDGYQFIRLSKGNSKKENIRIHRCVYSEFVGFTNNENHIDHYDNVKSNNDVTNLFEISIEDNNLKKGTYDNNAIFDRHDTENICKRLGNGENIDTIARDFVNNDNERARFYNYCTGLIRGLYHKDIVSKYNIYDINFTKKNQRRFYSQDHIKRVCELLEQGGKTKPQISTKTGVSLHVVKNVANRSSWNHISREYDF